MAIFNGGLDRRSLLSSAVGLAASAALQVTGEVPAEVTALPPAETAIFYGDDDGHVSVSEQEIARRCLRDKDHCRPTRIIGTFDRPHYRVIDVKAFLGLFRPGHLIDVPTDHEDDERTCSADVYPDRYEAFADTAAWNREQLEAWADEPVDLSSGAFCDVEWGIVLQVGRFEIDSLITVEFNRADGLYYEDCDNGRQDRMHVGVQETSLYQPVRVVHPTADEVARHGRMPAKLAAFIAGKGGVA
jgi:hypothetical protein